MSVVSEFGAARRGVEIYSEADGTEVERRAGDALHIQRWHIGLMMSDARTLGCTYVAFGFEPTRYSYRGATTWVNSAIGRIGVDVPTTSAVVVFVEVGLVIGFPLGRAPLTPAYITAGVRPTLGLRYRF
jgi:hypothetical protein